MEILVAVLARWFYVVFHLIPQVICRALPNAHGMLSALNLYIFLQALALLMFLFASMLSAASVRISAAIFAAAGAGAGDGGEGGDDVGGGGVAEGLLGPLGTPLRWSVLCVIYTLAVSALLFVGWSLWTITWETYYDFPTVRRMLQGPVKPERPGPTLLGTPRARGSCGGGGVPGSAKIAAQVAADQLAAAVAATSSDAEESDGQEEPPAPVEQRRLERVLLRSRSGSCASDPATVRRERRRQLVLTAPLVVLTLLHAVLLAGERFCGSHPSLCEGGTGVFHNHSRLNRIARLSLFISQIQLLVAFTSFFPRWDRVWSRGRRSGCLTYVLTLTLQFFLAPSLILQGAFFLSGRTPSPIILSLWSFWFLLGSTVVMRPENTIKAGFTFRTIADDSAWQHFSTLFKLTGVLWAVIYLAQQVMTSGFLSSQKDLIVIGVVYPLVWCVIWVATYIAVACAQYGRLFWYAFAFLAALCAVASWLLCALVGRSELLLLVDLVWVSLFGFGFRVLRHLAFGLQEAGGRAERKPRLSRSKTVKFVLAANLQTSHARKVAGETARVLWAATGLFCLVLAVCVVLAARQQQQQTDGDSLRWRAAPGGGLEIQKAGSTLNFGSRRQPDGLLWGNSSEDNVDEDPAFAVLPPGAQPRYAACGYKWHGLDLKDFALLSMAAYHTPTAGNDLPGLLRELLPGKNVTITKAVSGRRKWMELDVETCAAAPRTSATARPSCRTVTVVAVSGTDTSRVQDILENIRMWAEPVMFEIFSVVFPVVRAWPRETTAMMISGIHRIIRWLALQDDRWHYKEILDHVRGLPGDREVALTGHSLGGGIALVVGALSGRQAVAIQPPGLNHALAKHQEQNDAFGLGRGLHQSSVSLVVEHDPISLFDGHGGLVQTMACDRSAAAGGGGLGCHMLQNTICNLMRHCGDGEGRFSSCKLDLGAATDEEAEEAAAATQQEASLLPAAFDRLVGAGRLRLGAAPLAATVAAATASVMALVLATLRGRPAGSRSMRGGGRVADGEAHGEKPTKEEEEEEEERDVSGAVPLQVAQELPVVAARAG